MPVLVAGASAFLTAVGSAVANIVIGYKRRTMLASLFGFPSIHIQIKSTQDRLHMLITVFIVIVIVIVIVIMIVCGKR